jgi:hypothetical protein
LDDLASKSGSCANIMGMNIVGKSKANIAKSEIFTLFSSILYLLTPCQISSISGAILEFLT